MTKLKITGTFYTTEGGLGGQVLSLPSDEIEGFGWKGKKRVLLYLPNGEVLHRAVRPAKDGDYFIAINKAYMKKLGWTNELKVTVELESDESEYQMNTCEEFEAVMEMDPEAKKAFDNTNPGKQRGIMYYISGAKSSQVRIDRALMFAERLKNGEV